MADAKHTETFKTNAKYAAQLRFMATAPEGLFSPERVAKATGVARNTAAKDLIALKARAKA